ncbi:MAG: 30S ribosomal protein S3 [Candidatus Micrarchaeota archaeon]|nr:30S ribosomal protein S3 [Candidatus Micrarchaeota archaeon]
MMGPEVNFINEAIIKYKIRKFLEKELERFGFSEVDIQRTPVLTRIIIKLQNPSKVTGKRAYRLTKVTQILRDEFGIDNPQIAITSVQNPGLDPMIVARKAVRLIEMGKPIRNILQKTVEEVMEAGAQGVEIVASGKIVGKGGRAKSLRVSAGYVPKAGDITYSLKKALQVAYPKSGAIGVYVTIVTPDIVIPDKIKQQPQAENKKEDVIVKEQQNQSQIKSEVLKQDKYQMSVEEVPLKENKEEKKSKQPNKYKK